MNAIRIRRRLDSEDLHLPELRPLIGKQVEILVVEEDAAEQPEPKVGNAFFELAKRVRLAPDTAEYIKKMREISKL